MRALVLFAALSLAGPAAAASFDCTRASTPDERAICASPHLSALDMLVSRAYGDAHARNADAGDRAHALDDFGTLDSTVQPPAWLPATDMTPAVPAESRALPSREGDCARSRVTDIGGRLEDDTDFSSGTTVELADGLRQVSYDRVAAVVDARRGDPVLVCLTSIPKHCPPGDDRGRFYTATDLRARRSWSLPDAQHMCGGA